MGVAQPPRSYCAPCSAMLSAFPKASTSTSPDRGNGERHLPHVGEFLTGLDSMWEDRVTRWTLRVRSALEEGQALPPFPTAEWSLGSQNVFEAGNELPLSPTAAAGPARESDPLAAGVTPLEGATLSSEGDPGGREQTEPGSAVSVATGNFCRTQGDDGAGTLARAPNTAQRHPSNIESGYAYVHWCSRAWEKHKRQTRSTARIRKGNTSDENWGRNHHELGANPSTRKRRGSPGPC